MTSHSHHPDPSAKFFHYVIGISPTSSGLKEGVAYAQANMVWGMVVLLSRILKPTQLLSFVECESHFYVYMFDICFLL